MFVFQSFEEEEKKERKKKKKVSQGNKESHFCCCCPVLLYNSYQKGREQNTKMCVQPLLVVFLFLFFCSVKIFFVGVITAC